MLGALSHVVLLAVEFSCARAKGGAQMDIAIARSQNMVGKNRILIIRGFGGEE